MKTPPCLLALIASFAFATSALAQPPRLVRVTLDSRLTLERLLEAGADVVNARAGGWADVLEWPGDEARLAALGARLRLLDADPGRTAADRARAELAASPAPARRQVLSATRPDGTFRIESYPPAGSGSLGGYWTLDEVKMKLDDLVASDTRNLVADKLDTLGYSLQGRPIWGLKLGTPATGPDTRPAVLYTALTHAREPGGMQALFYFVDDLLSKYDGDPVAKYLLENRQVYLCPVVNPDGYAFDGRIYDSTAAFGYWRKNLRDNDANGVTTTNDGVDINRNYGYQWGLNGLGSSGTFSADDYRGTAAWSEPETRVQRDLVVALRPVTGLSFHTYSDLMLHAWGWTTVGTPDSAKFQEWSDELTLDNGFASGPSPRVLYPVNGEFNDWVYGDTLLKPRGYTWTPEIGDPNDGFWPPPSRMTPLSQSTLRASWTVAGLAGPWVRAERTTILEGALDAGNAAHLVVRARNIGTSGTAGPGLVASLTALDPATEVLSGPVAYPALGSLQSGDPSAGGSFWVAAADTVTPGRMVRFTVDFSDDSGLRCRDTIEVVVGTPTYALIDSCSSLARWTPKSGSLWGVVANDPVHPDLYLSDSPAGVYPNNYDGEITLTVPLDLSAGVHAWVFLQDRWAFESDFDGGVLEASTNGTTWSQLATHGTTASSSASILGPGLNAFEGTRWRWRDDRADLSAFAGGPAATAVRLRWRSRSDSFTQLDGMNFDTLRVAFYDPASQLAPAAVGPAARVASLAFAPPAPNPAGDRVIFAFDVPAPGTVAIDVLDVQGRALLAHTGGAAGAPAGAHMTWGWDLRGPDGRRVAPGIYLARLRAGGREAVRRFVVLR